MLNYTSRYKLILRAVATALVCLLLFNNVATAGDSIRSAYSNLLPKILLSDAEKRAEFQAELICELIEKRANYGKKPEDIYLGDVLLWKNLEEKGKINFANTELEGCKIDLSWLYEIRISIPSSNIIVRYFDPEKANKNAPFTASAVSKTVPINANLHRQILLHATKALPASTIEQLIESTVNPYWTNMRGRLEALRTYVDDGSV